MHEHKKEDSCSSDKQGCGCCCKVNKLVAAIAIGILIFICGYIFAKGACPFNSSQTCPIMKK